MLLSFTILFQLKKNENIFTNDSECFPDCKNFRIFRGLFQGKMKEMSIKNYKFKRPFNNNRNHRKYLSLAPNS